MEISKTVFIQVITSLCWSRGEMHFQGCETGGCAGESLIAFSQTCEDEIINLLKQVIHQETVEIDTTRKDTHDQKWLEELIQEKIDYVKTWKVDHVNKM